MSIQKELLASIRTQPRTISELSELLNLTRTAVKHQLNKLLQDGLVVEGDMRRMEKAGKPAREFKIAPGSEDANSSAYIPFIVGLLETLPNHLEKQDRVKLFETIGRNMASHAGLPEKESVKERLKDAINLVNTLGASAELVEEDSQLMIKNMSCPLASAVREEPCVCDAVASFFSKATGLNVRAECSYGEMLVCRYKIKSKQRLREKSPA